MIIHKIRAVLSCNCFGQCSRSLVLGKIKKCGVFEKHLLMEIEAYIFFCATGDPPARQRAISRLPESPSYPAIDGILYRSIQHTPQKHLG